MSDYVSSDDADSVALLLYFEQKLLPLRGVGESYCAVFDIGTANLACTLLHQLRPIPEFSLDAMLPDAYATEELRFAEVLVAMKTNLLAPEGITWAQYIEPEIDRQARAVSIELTHHEPSSLRLCEGDMHPNLDTLRMACSADDGNGAPQYQQVAERLSQFVLSEGLRWLFLAPYPLAIENQCDQVDAADPGSPMNFLVAHMLISLIHCIDRLKFGEPRAVSFVATKYGLEQCMPLVAIEYPRVTTQYGKLKKASIIACLRLLRALGLHRLARFIETELVDSRGRTKEDDVCDVILMGLEFMRKCMRVRAVGDKEIARVREMAPARTFSAFTKQPVFPDDDDADSCVGAATAVPRKPKQPTKPKPRKSAKRKTRDSLVEEYFGYEVEETQTLSDPEPALRAAQPKRRKVSSDPPLKSKNKALEFPDSDDDDDDDYSSKPRATTGKGKANVPYEKRKKLVAAQADSSPPPKAHRSKLPIGEISTANTASTLRRQFAALTRVPPLVIDDDGNIDLTGGGYADDGAVGLSSSTMNKRSKQYRKDQDQNKTTRGGLWPTKTADEMYRDDII